MSPLEHELRALRLEATSLRFEGRRAMLRSDLRIAVLMNSSLSTVLVVRLQETRAHDLASVQLNQEPSAQPPEPGRKTRLQA